MNQSLPLHDQNSVQSKSVLAEPSSTKSWTLFPGNAPFLQWSNLSVHKETNQLQQVSAVTQIYVIRAAYSMQLLKIFAQTFMCTSNQNPDIVCTQHSQCRWLHTQQSGWLPFWSICIPAHIWTMNLAAALKPPGAKAIFSLNWRAVFAQWCVKTHRNNHCVSGSLFWTANKQKPSTGSF